MSERNTTERQGKRLVLPVLAGAVINAGCYVALTATGFAKEGAVAADLIGIGRAEETVDNTAGADGDVFVEVKQGCFKWDNDTADAVSLTNVSKDCYIVDANTVSISSDTNARSIAGKVLGVDDDGVWVKTEI